jgi:hypothetical protein
MRQGGAPGRPTAPGVTVGLITIGVIGFFIGPLVLALGYTLLVDWGTRASHLTNILIMIFAVAPMRPGRVRYFLSESEARVWLGAQQ